jgi:lipopolysaccharide export system protein LptA
MTEMFGPTRIVSSTDELFCILGKYDTQKEIAMFGKNSVVQSKSNLLTADSIYYEKYTQFGKAYRNIELYDTSNEVIVYGEYGEMKGKTQESMVTRNAVAKQYMNQDSMFMFADTILSYKFKDGKQIVRAYRLVKLFKHDMQAISDSLIYNKSDSSITLYHNPVMWSGSNQITADTIRLFMRNNQLDSFVLMSNAFLISREAVKQYNQIKGRNMYGFFNENKIRYLHVNGNGQSIYYAKDDSDFIGVNVNECSEMEFFFENNKIRRCNFINKPAAVFHPLNELKPDELRLKGFQWLNSRRPSPSLIMKRFYNKRLFFKKNFK